MAMGSKITKAVGLTFPSEGISLWHSIGPAAFQEVAHLQFHMHPRKMDDGLLRIYSQGPATPDEEALDLYAENIKQYL